MDEKGNSWLNHPLVRGMLVFSAFRAVYGIGILVVRFRTGARTRRRRTTNDRCGDLTVSYGSPGSRPAGHLPIGGR